jgi:hypothetical protein
VTKRALCVGCWSRADYSESRTVWLGVDASAVICSDCEQSPTERVERLLAMGQRWTERRAL